MYVAPNSVSGRVVKTVIARSCRIFVDIHRSMLRRLHRADDREIDFRADALADPVALHFLQRLGPLERSRSFEQPLGVLR